MKKIILTGIMLLSLINLKAQITKKIDCNEGLHWHLDYTIKQMRVFVNQIEFDLDHENLSEDAYKKYYWKIQPLIGRLEMLDDYFLGTMKDSVDNKRIQPWVEWEQKDILCECATKIVKK